jgi:hypothetical protein
VAGVRAERVLQALVQPAISVITYTVYVNTFMERKWGVPLVEFSTGRFKCG